MTEEFKDWLGWAKQKADWYDPIVNASDKLLPNIDSDGFKEKDK